MRVVLVIVAGAVLAAPLPSSLAGVRALHAQEAAVPARASADTMVAVDTAMRRATAAFETAARMVREGQGDSGRALVDSVLQRARPGTPVYAEALYWRGALASSAADAERDYRRLVVEYSTSRRAEDALLNLAQIELARGARTQALTHLARLEREHPESPLRPRAALLTARVHFAGGDTGRGCVALADARRTAQPSAVELRNQIEYFTPRCPAVEPTAPRVASSDSARPAPSASGGSTSTVPNTSGGAPVTTATAPAVKPSAPATVSAAPAARPSAPVGAPRWTVQVAAYDQRDSAERLAAQLRAGGNDARVFGTARPFRVRVGRFAVRAEAERALQSVRARHPDAFMTTAEPGTP